MQTIVSISVTWLALSAIGQAQVPVINEPIVEDCGFNGLVACVNRYVRSSSEAILDVFLLKVNRLPSFHTTSTGLSHLWLPIMTSETQMSPVMLHLGF